MFREPESQWALTSWETKRKPILKATSSRATKWSIITPPVTVPAVLLFVLIPSTWFHRHTKQTAEPRCHMFLLHGTWHKKPRKQMRGLLQGGYTFSDLDRLLNIWRCPVAPLQSVMNTGEELRGWGSEWETWDLVQALSNFFGNCRDMRWWRAAPQRDRSWPWPQCQLLAWALEDAWLAFCSLGPVFFQ